MVKKIIIISILILITPKALAYDNYVSPESYAVNEADLVDYRYIPPSPKLNLEYLESIDSNPKQKTSETKITEKKTKPEKIKKEKQPKAVKEEDPEAYKKKLSYKVAKWWVDKRYEREEPHHGTKHEIKVQARENYEKRLEEEKLNKENNSI